MLNTVSKMAEFFHPKMNETTSILSEYSTIMAVNSIDLTIGSRLMAENRDVTCFIYHGTWMAFIIVAPRKNDFG